MLGILIELRYSRSIALAIQTVGAECKISRKKGLLRNKKNPLFFLMNRKLHFRITPNKSRDDGGFWFYFMCGSKLHFEEVYSHYNSFPLRSSKSGCLFIVFMFWFACSRNKPARLLEYLNSMIEKEGTVQHVYFSTKQFYVSQICVELLTSLWQNINDVISSGKQKFCLSKQLMDTSLDKFLYSTQKLTDIFIYSAVSRYFGGKFKKQKRYQ